MLKFETGQKLDRILDDIDETLVEIGVAEGIEYLEQLASSVNGRLAGLRDDARRASRGN